ncbi:MAG: hypothetical protein V4493_00880 [Pseudomonadota bacterium]
MSAINKLAPSPTYTKIAWCVCTLSVPYFHIPTASIPSDTLQNHQQLPNRIIMIANKISLGMAFAEVLLKVTGGY